MVPKVISLLVLAVSNVLIAAAVPVKPVILAAPTTVETLVFMVFKSAALAVVSGVMVTV